jgi:hypothetical protein
MPKSLANPAVRKEMIDRLARLSKDASPQWGRMNATQMLAHLVDWMAMADGSLPTAPIRKAGLHYPIMKQLAIYWLPFPRNVMTAPELKRRQARDWSVELESVRQCLADFQSLATRVDWPPHPVFGRMTRRAWCVFAYRHMDHHFRQFGV